MLPLSPAPTPGLSPAPTPAPTPTFTLPSLYTSLSHELPAIKSRGKDPCPRPGGQSSPTGPP